MWIWLRSSILGAHNNASVANTRPFILYTKTGEPFEAFAPSSSLTSRSPIFRVESIDDDDCAVLRVLTVVLGDGTAVPPGDDQSVRFSCTKCKTNINLHLHYC